MRVTITLDVGPAEGAELSELEVISLKLQSDDCDPKLRDRVMSYTDEEASALLSDWSFVGRPSQQTPPGDWFVWLILAGRGWGKTRTGAEWIRASERAGFSRFHLVAATAADYRDVMIEGESGLQSVYRSASERPTYIDSRRRVDWPSGAYALCFSSEKPRQLRGPQCEKAWADEPAAWAYPRETWENMELGVRLGDAPQIVATTTPKPLAFLKELAADAEAFLTSGSSYDNRSNLSPRWFKRLLRKYEGTRLAMQELYAQFLEDVEGALWQRELLNRAQWNPATMPAPPRMVRVIVAVDPSGGEGKKGDECGIVVAGLGADGLLWILEDASERTSPEKWGAIVYRMYEKWGADAIVAEVNFGAEMVRLVMKTVAQDEGVNPLPFKKLHASRGKSRRAEPVVALYEQNRVRHLDRFALLEDQMAEWVEGESDFSPDRMDALVWAGHELLLGPVHGSTIGTAAGARMPGRGNGNGARLPRSIGQSRRTQSGLYVVGEYEEAA